MSETIPGTIPETVSESISGRPLTPARQARSRRTRAALLDAALTEFATRGFDAASTRRIATLAGTHHPQINYHFASKEVLWRAAVDHLFERFDAALQPADDRASRPDAGEDVADERVRFAAAVRRLVRAVAACPELNRMMVQEAMADSDRLDWIVDRHVRPRFDTVGRRWRSLRDAGGAGHLAPADETIIYYTLVGGASLLYVNAPEARRLTGREPNDPAVVEAHADVLVRMLLGAEA